MRAGCVLGQHGSRVSFLGMRVVYYLRGRAMTIELSVGWAVTCNFD